MTRSSWHLRTGAIVVAWLVALAVVSALHPFLPVARWLLVHLLLLGAVSNAILIWSSHFATALLRLPDGTRGQAARLGLLNAGAVAVVVGVVSDRWPATLVGGLAVAGAGAWHATTLLRRMRRALPSRFGATVRYYVTAGVLLPVGVALGVVMARGELGAMGYAQVVVAHAVLNLLGWVGLPVLGTLVTLWPTMLRTRISDGAERAARRALPLLLVGLLLAAGAALGGSRMLAAAGLIGYLAGVVVVTAPHIEEGRRRPPTTFATRSVLAGTTWLVVSLLALAAGTVTASGWDQVATRASWLTAPLLAGFAAQVLLGALSYLVPVVLGGGPQALRAATAVLERGGPARVALANAGLVVWVLPVPGVVRAVSAVLVAAALATFLPLVVRAVFVARSTRGAVILKTPMSHGDRTFQDHGGGGVRGDEDGA